jgi:predicted histidine transporter YuiF (NhaC family)
LRRTNKKHHKTCTKDVQQQQAVKEMKLTATYRDDHTIVAVWALVVLLWVRLAEWMIMWAAFRRPGGLAIIIFQAWQWMKKGEQLYPLEEIMKLHGIDHVLRALQGFPNWIFAQTYDIRL